MAKTRDCYLNSELPPKAFSEKNCLFSEIRKNLNIVLVVVTCCYAKSRKKNFMKNSCARNYDAADKVSPVKMYVLQMFWKIYEKRNCICIFIFHGF